MVIGGMLGASFWRLTYGVLPQVPSSPAPFVVVGMMALFGGVAHAPLAVMLMVAEMTGNLSLLAPAMIAVSVSTALVGNQTIYRSQLPTRAASPAHRAHLSFPLLASLRVREAMVPYTDGHVDASTSDLSPGQTLDDALEQMAEDGSTQARVVENGRVVGQLGQRDVVAAYKRGLVRGIRRANTLPASAALVDLPIESASPLVSRQLRDAGLAPRALVVAVNRDGEVLFPTAETCLQAGDVLTVLAEPRAEASLRALAQGTSVASVT
jgi:CIC family chloride channel protein